METYLPTKRSMDIYIHVYSTEYSADGVGTPYSVQYVNSMEVLRTKTEDLGLPATGESGRPAFLGKGTGSQG